MVLSTDTFVIQTFVQVASIIRYITKYLNAIRSFAATFCLLFPGLKKAQKKINLLDSLKQYLLCKIFYLDAVKKREF